MANNINLKGVGKRIKSIRQSKGYSQEEFGELLNDANKSLVSRWENGKNLPNNERLKAIASIGDMTVQELLYGDLLQKNYTDDFFEEFKKFIARKNGPLEEFKLLAPGALSGLTMGLAFKEMAKNAVKDNEALQDRIKVLEKFAHDYINKNYSNYTYEKFRQDFPNSNLQDFQEDKERRIALFVEILENYWKVLDKNYKSYSIINSRFTNQISDELTKIIKKAIEEDREDYYIEEVVQPILDQAAKDFKESIKDYIDTED